MADTPEETRTRVDSPSILQELRSHGFPEGLVASKSISDELAILYLSAEKLRQDIDRKQAESELERLGIDMRGKQEYYTLRRHWSFYLMVLLGVMVGFQISLSILIGCKVLDFSGLRQFLNILIGETFLQIATMCVIVVRFLFPPENNRDRHRTKETEKPQDGA